MYEKKNKSTKIVVLLVVLMLLIGGTIGGTLAWLIAESDTVVNTFTVGDINITLTEANPGVTNNTRDSIKLVPGAVYVKDPKVTVLANSEDCWLFVKIEESDAANLINYGINETVWGSTPVESGTGYVVYGMKVEADDENQDFYVLADTATPTTTDKYDNGCVTISSTATKANMDAIKAGTATAPTLTFTAYAIQSENLTKTENGTTSTVTTAAEAWTIYKASTTTNP